MIEPMLCHDGDPERFPGDGWVLEPKHDGWRFLFWRTTAGSPVRVRSYSGRNGSERTGQHAFWALVLTAAELGWWSILTEGR